MKEKGLEILNVVLAIILAALIFFTTHQAHILYNVSVLREVAMINGEKVQEQFEYSTFFYGKVLEVDKEMKKVKFEISYEKNKVIEFLYDSEEEGKKFEKGKKYVVQFLDSARGLTYINAKIME